MSARIRSILAHTVMFGCLAVGGVMLIYVTFR